MIAPYDTSTAVGLSPYDLPPAPAPSPTGLLSGYAPLNSLGDYAPTDFPYPVPGYPYAPPAPAPIAGTPASKAAATLARLGRLGRFGRMGDASSVVENLVGDATQAFESTQPSAVAAATYGGGTTGVVPPGVNAGSISFGGSTGILLLVGAGILAFAVVGGRKQKS